MGSSAGIDAAYATRLRIGTGPKSGCAIFGEAPNFTDVITRPPTPSDTTEISVTLSCTKTYRMVSIPQCRDIHPESGTDQ